MTPKILLLMSALSFSAGGATAASHPADTLTTRDGKQLTITFFGHASLSLEMNGKYIYVDPVSDYADYAALPKADLILVTHNHGDHLDLKAIAALSTPQTEVVCDHTSAEQITENSLVMRPGDVQTPRDYVRIMAVAAYNTSPAQLQFHPESRQDCGYVLTLSGSRIYIAGDTEPTPEMWNIKNLDVAFLPVNQPYTMTVDEAVKAVKALQPAIFYPYHYGGTDQTTDIDRLVSQLQGVTDVRIRPME